MGWRFNLFGLLTWKVPTLGEEYLIFEFLVFLVPGGGCGWRRLWLWHDQTYLQGRPYFSPLQTVVWVMDGFQMNIIYTNQVFMSSNFHQSGRDLGLISDTCFDQISTFKWNLIFRSWGLQPARQIWNYWRERAGLEWLERNILQFSCFMSRPNFLVSEADQNQIQSVFIKTRKNLPREAKLKCVRAMPDIQMPGRVVSYGPVL